jgi:peptidyl-prolyl cis-trans isomerase B (cyclophilin B)
VTSLTASLLPAVAAAAAAVSLGACGTTTHARNSANASANGASTSGEDKHGGCRGAREPAPKGPQHVPRPTGRLDPSKRYVVTLVTNCGSIAIKLDVAHAPKTTSSFAYLVKRGFYNDLTFHRVAANFVIQGGDPNGDGSGGPGYTIVEPPPADLKYTRGTVAMAKTATDPAGASGSQFFIVTASDTELPPQYALLGNVVGSMAGVNAIASLATNPPQDGQPIQPVVISQAMLSQS